MKLDRDISPVMSEDIGCSILRCCRCPLLKLQSSQLQGVQHYIIMYLYTLYRARNDKVTQIRTDTSDFAIPKSDQKQILVPPSPIGSLLLRKFGSSNMETHGITVTSKSKGRKSTLNLKQKSALKTSWFPRQLSRHWCEENTVESLNKFETSRSNRIASTASSTSLTHIRPLMLSKFARSESDSPTRPCHS